MLAHAETPCIVVVVGLIVLVVRIIECTPALWRRERRLSVLRAMARWRSKEERRNGGDGWEEESNGGATVHVGAIAQPLR
jgi:hypothetical protein